MRRTRIALLPLLIFAVGCATIPSGIIDDFTPPQAKPDEQVKPPECVVDDDQTPETAWACVAEVLSGKVPVGTKARRGKRPAPAALPRR